MHNQSCNRRAFLRRGAAFALGAPLALNPAADLLLAAESELSKVPGSLRAKAKVAIARKIAVILHCIWVDGTSFDWGQPKPI